MNDSDSDSEKCEISAQEIFDTVNKIMEYTREEKIHPLLVMAACPVIEEYIAYSAGVSRREMDMSRRGAHKLVQALSREMEHGTQADEEETTDQKH